MAMRRKRAIQPWPWHVKFRQYDGKSGKPSRPQIVDDRGEPVRLNNIRQATLASMAPLLLDRLAKLTYKCEMLHLQVCSELAINLPVPKEITESQEILRIANAL